MTKAGVAEIAKQGNYTFDEEFGWVTPTINNGICAYAYRDSQKVIKCSFEEAYNKGLISWKKPLSCHLFPIRITQSELDPDLEYVNYEPRTDLCGGGCSLGTKLKVPVYEFLKEALIRKYGKDFYESLVASAQYLK